MKPKVAKVVAPTKPQDRHRYSTFPDSDIRDFARELIIVADANSIDLGGDDGAILRLGHAMAIARRLSRACNDAARLWGLEVPTA